jgi:hypothetical protein
MILESAQLLSTAHRVLDGRETTRVSASGRQSKYWQLPDTRNDLLYSATHIRHPSALWVREDAHNYAWLYQLFCCLLDEYRFRYEKIHACTKLLSLLQLPPAHSVSYAFSEPTLAMPEQFKVAGNAMRSYHNYYNGAKTALFAWKKRPIPEWVILPKH